MYIYTVEISVVDPFHFGVDPDTFREIGEEIPIVSSSFFTVKNIILKTMIYFSY